MPAEERGDDKDKGLTGLLRSAALLERLCWPEAAEYVARHGIVHLGLIIVRVCVPRSGRERTPVRLMPRGGDKTTHDDIHCARLKHEALGLAHVVLGS